MANQGGQIQQTGGGTSCPDPMTRNALLALRNSGSLLKDCHYVITNASTDGNLDVQEILLHAVNGNTLSMQAGILTSHDNTAWQGVYDIDTNNVIEVIDNLENKVVGNGSIINFPFGVTSVADNTVHSDSIITYVGGTVNGNTFMNNSAVRINSGTFSDNVISTDANITSNGNVRRNIFSAQSNTTINSGDFLENEVKGDATVISSTTGDVDNNIFSANSNSTISGTANLDTSEIGTDANLTLTGGNVTTTQIGQNGNLTMSGGAFADNTIGQDAEVTIIGQSNYENTFGDSTIFRQVGTGYIRYSTIKGTTTWTNGNNVVSNVTAHTATVNTTGSAGTISNSTLDRAYMQNLQNIPSLTITDSTISNYATVQTNGSTRIYIYRSTVTDGSRVLCSAGSRIDMSYTHLDSYSYLQSTGVGGILYANYCNLTSLGYIRNLTTNTNRAERCKVGSQSSIRFDGNANNCRVYYSIADGGGAIYHTGNSVNCYTYYSSAIGLGQIYTTGSTNARIYYCSASSRGYIRSLNCVATHYMYYCEASASGYVQMNAAGGRMYAVTANSQSIVEKRGAAGNIYYSTFTAYFYAYITRTGGTSSGLFGMGRRTQTVTTPLAVLPFAVGSAWLNFQ